MPNTSRSVLRIALRRVIVSRVVVATVMEVGGCVQRGGSDSGVASYRTAASRHVREHDMLIHHDVICMAQGGLMSKIDKSDTYPYASGT